jgi:hypothetical protein
MQQYIIINNTFKKSIIYVYILLYMDMYLYIDPCYLSDKRDVISFSHGIKFMRQLLTNNSNINSNFHFLEILPTTLLPHSW